ncbi:MAG: helix-turn-helix transcriptional regulator [bacterium]|nr:helix-turn-helix transcriptional regulator [bacterium]
MEKKDKKETLKIAGRFKKIREVFELSQEKMAKKLGVTRSTYTRYETARLIPGRLTLKKLAFRLNISMDWLLFNKGPMLYKEKIAGTKGEDPKTAAETSPELELAMGDAKEMLGYMVKHPLFQFEMLTHFHRFKLENKELVEPSATE